MSMDLHIREPNASSPRTKPAPKQSSIPVPFAYNPSDDGTDENLLILLHGLGDTHVPFFNLAKSLKLPQTATLALRAPSQIPLLEQASYQWYTSFSPLGELLPPSSPHLNPTPAFELLSKLLSVLTGECGWPPQNIHLFGFGQGGSLAVEAGLRFWREGNTARALASIVTISGPLLSYPTLPPSSLCPTPVLYFHRPPPSAAASTPSLNALKKAFSTVREVKMPYLHDEDGEPAEAMPRNRTEWEPVMRFWSERLLKRRWGDGEQGVYEVLSGMAR